jgi:hypothetical protein
MRPVLRDVTSSGVTFEEAEASLGARGGCGGTTGEIGASTWEVGGKTGGHDGAPNIAFTTAVRMVGADNTVKLSSADAAVAFASLRVRPLAIALLCAASSAEIVTVSATLAAAAATSTLETLTLARSANTDATCAREASPNASMEPPTCKLMTV